METLKEQLKAASTNSNIKKLGVLHLKTISSPYVSNMTLFLRIVDGATATIDAIGGTFISTNPPYDPIESHYNLVSGRSYGFAAPLNNPIGIEINPKYNIMNLENNFGIGLDISDLTYASGLNSLKLKGESPYGTFDPSNWSVLKVFSIVGSNIKGNIEGLINCPILQQLVVNTNQNIEGSVEALANISTLTKIDLTSTSKITGDANIFADSSKFVGLTTLNLQYAVGITNKTAAVKALIEAAHQGITVTW